MKNSRNSLSLKLHDILSSVMRPRAVPFLPTMDSMATPPAGQSPSSHLSNQTDFPSDPEPMFKKPLFFLMMAPKLWSGDSNMPRKAHKVLPLSEKVEVLHLTRQFIISHHHKKKEEYSTKYFERGHIHVTFITLQCIIVSVLLYF